MSIFGRIRQAVSDYGTRGTLRIAYYRALDYRSRRRTAKYLATFDSRFGVETSEVVWRSNLSAVGRNKGHSTWYQPVGLISVADIVRILKLDLAGVTFVDLGSGKGRVMFDACQFAFRRVIGVEFSPELHEAALRNAALFSGRLWVIPEPICADACEFSFPADPLVVFMFNPFDGVIMKSVAANLERSLRDCPRPAYVVYVFPFQRAVFQTPRWKLVRDTGDCCMFKAVA